MLTADAEAARGFLIEARQLSARLGERELEGYAAFYHGLTHTLDMAAGPARTHLEAARALHHAAHSRRGEGLATATLGLTFLMAGEPARARELLEEALAMQIVEGYRWGEGHARLYLAITLETTDPQAASAHYQQAVNCLRPYRDSILLPNALVGQAGLIARRDPATALRVCAAAWSIRLRAGGDLPPFYRERLKAVKAACEATLGDAAERSWTEGTRLAIDDAIAIALGAATIRAAAPAGLSARELEVVRLVARGLANKAIASQLHLSVRTVESHVRHVLAKVGLRNRTQLAAWAREHSQ